MTTDWLSAIGILLAGLVAGFMFVYASMRKKQDAVRDDVDRRDLEAKRDALISMLRADDLAPSERTRIEREAADVLRALDATVIPSVSEGSGRVGREAKASSSALAGFLWGASSVIAIVAVIWFATKNATPKETPQPTQQSSSLDQLESTVKANPDDTEARIALAKAYLDRENLIGVFEQTNAVLAKNPADARAQTYQAIVRMAMGQKDEAMKLLATATSTDPKLTDAWVALAYLRTQQSDNDGATRAIESAIQQHPEDEQRLRSILSQMQQRPSPSSSLSGAAAPPPPQAQGPSVHVRIDLAPNARPTGILFIYARDAANSSGPPAAVKRLEVTSFPIEIDLSAADSMMGQPLPAKMRVEARLDADGNVMTKDPADPKASADNVAAGANVTLTLR